MRLAATRCQEEDRPVAVLSGQVDQAGPTPAMLPRPLRLAAGLLRFSISATGVDSGAPPRGPYRLLAPAGVLVAAIVAVGYISTVDPNETGHYPTCPFLALTGYQCPGCGTLRMIHALASGHLATAFSLNALSFVLLPVLCAAWVRWTAAAVGGRPVRPLVNPTPTWILLGAVIAFWIGRNLTSAW